MTPSEKSRLAQATMTRRSQRIELSQSLRALFGETPALVVELSSDGAAIEHDAHLGVNTGARLYVESRPPFTVSAVIRHSVMTAAGNETGTTYRSGLLFRDVDEAAEATIESILIDQAMSLVRLWEANAAGLTSSPAIAAMQQQSSLRAPSAYLWLRLVNGRWERTTTLDPNQPLDGFAVTSGEAQAQIELLCRTYETASIAERHFIRAVAQRAIAERIAERRGDRLTV